MGETVSGIAKLTNKKRRWIVRHCVEIRDFSKVEAAQIYGVTTRRVQQILKEYRETAILGLFMEHTERRENDGVK